MSLIWTVVLLLAGSLPARAQVSWENPFRANGAHMKIENLSEDGYYAFLQIGLEKIAPLAPRDHFALSWRGPLGGWLQRDYGTISFDVTGYMCEAVTYEEPFPIPDVAQMDVLASTDKGDLRITPPVLAGMTAKELEQRVADIRRVWKRTDILGRKLAEKELETWSRLVLRFGLDRVRPKCAGRWYPLPERRVTLHRSRYSIRQETYTIRGSNGRYRWTY